MPSRSKLQLSDLTDDCFHHIFARTETADLLRSVRLTCTRLARLQASVCSGRHHLTLFIGYKDITNWILNHSKFALPYIIHIGPDRKDSPATIKQLAHVQEGALSKETLHFSSLHFRLLSAAISTQLLATFPNVRHLRLCLDKNLHCKHIEAILTLIDGWSGSLKRLEIWSKDDKIFSLQAHLDLINKLPHLRLFRLEAPRLRLEEDIQLPVVRQLTELYLDVHHLDPNAAWFTEHFHQNTAIKSAAFGPFYDISLIDRLLSTSEPEVLRKLTFLPLGGYLHPRVDQLSELCQRMTHLTSISLNICHFSLADLTRHLARLPFLLHLHLYVYSYHGSSAFPYLLIFDDATAPTTPLEPITPLVGLRILTLDVKLGCHSDLKYLYPGWAFPNLQVLQINTHGMHYICSGCREFYSRWTGSRAHALVARLLILSRTIRPEKCLRAQMKPFARECRALRCIHLEVKGKMRSVESRFTRRAGRGGRGGRREAEVAGDGEGEEGFVRRMWRQVVGRLG